MPNPNGNFPHSFVITDVDEDKLIIYVNDPVYGKQRIPTLKFMELWVGSYHTLIRFKIGEKVTLYEYTS